MYRHTIRDNKEVNIGKRPKAQRLYRKQFVYYTISHAFTDILVLLYHIVFSRSFVLKRKEKTLNKTSHNPNSQFLPRLAYIFTSFPKQPIILKAFLSLNSVLRLVEFYGPSSFLWLFKCFSVDSLRQGSIRGNVSRTNMA
jgi:hypothetical protein